MRSTTVLTCFALLLLAAPASAQKSDTKKTDTKKTDTKKTDDAKKGDSDAKDDKAPAPKEKGDGKDTDKKDTEGDDAKKASDPSSKDWDISDVEETPGKSYFFVGLRYRGNIIPNFMLNIFVDEGTSIYTNMIGVEFDLRKDGFSLVPALSYHELGTGDILFRQKNTKDLPQNYGLVNSSMKVIYASVDVLWSTKISKNVEFEYGAGFGLGAVFGDLENSWVKEDEANGQYTAANGKKYSRCETVLQPGTGCNRQDHQNASVDKVGGYKEPSWFSGGSKPALFPWIAVPQLGVRIKPIKNFVGRIGLGFALTGFWFGINGEYGLERKPHD
jgi:hypothetical protein